MFIRVQLPDGNSIWVAGGDPQAARLAVINFMRGQGVNLNEGDLVTVGSSGPPQGGTLLNQSGQNIGTGLGRTGEETFPGTTGETDTGVRTDVGTDGDRDVRQEIGRDIQAFPFASFANALAGRGLDTEGVLGSTLSQSFQPLSLAAQLGSLTGTVPAIGQGPGALESFFANRLGQGGNLAQQTFDALRAGQVAEGLAPNVLSGFRAPDIATQQGLADARTVLDLARQAAVNRFGSFGAELLPTTGQAISRFQRPLAQGQTPDFLQFAASQFGV